MEDATAGSLNKHLTLDYDFLGNDYFDLYIIEDKIIELCHGSSQTTSTFKGRNAIQVKSSCIE